MEPEFFDEDGLPVLFSISKNRKADGPLLPGAIIKKAGLSSGTIELQEWGHSFYDISCRIFQFFKKFSLKVKENRLGMRIEAVLTGELNTVSASGKPIKLLSGQYHLTDLPAFTALFQKGTACSYFVSHYPDPLIAAFGFSGTVAPCEPRYLPDKMYELIQEALHSPIEEKLRDFYYENTVRELLRFHLMGNQPPLPGTLSDADIAAIYHADSIIAAHLDEHYSIRELSRMVGINVLKLKRGFRTWFHTGVFGRLIFWRMKKARLLLETTSRMIKAIALESGYANESAFSTAFKKRHGMTPLEWRKKSAEGKFT